MAGWSQIIALGGTRPPRKYRQRWASYRKENPGLALSSFRQRMRFTQGQAAAVLELTLNEVIGLENGWVMFQDPHDWKRAHQLLRMASGQVG